MGLMLPLPSYFCALTSTQLAKKRVGCLRLTGSRFYLHARLLGLFASSAIVRHRSMYYIPPQPLSTTFVLQAWCAWSCTRSCR